MRKLIMFFLPVIVLAVCPSPMAKQNGAAMPAGETTRIDPLFKFLWPTGEDLRELTINVKDDREIDTPLGKRKAAVAELVSVMDEHVATARVFRVEDEGGFEATVFETDILADITSPTGDYFKPMAALPAVAHPTTLDRVLTFEVKQFSPPIYEPVATTGPVVLYNDDFDVMIISPLDNFMAAMQAPDKGWWLSGFAGTVEKIPAGTTHRVVVVTGRGLKDTFLYYGDFVRKWHGRERVAQDADVGLKYLGYYTDNGAYYYYKEAEGMNYQDTLLAVKKDADQRGIPYRYFQIDSWWYPKAKSNSITGAFRGGAMLWEPIPEMFPQGLGAFHERLGLPLVAHNRWYDKNSPYCKRYECVQGVGGKDAALPIEPAFWDEIMKNAVSYGVEVYEQDWLETQMAMIPWLRSGFRNAESWFDSMLRSAADRGLTVQLCMASPQFFLQQVKHGVVTQIRCSNDYQAGMLKAYYWRNFQTVSMFAYAMGMWPFKDNFQSSRGQRLIRNERWPFEEALVSILGAGVVGPGDKIGAADAELLNRTCRRDGVLLKPDIPAMPIDLMYLDTAKPWIVTTESSHDFGKTYYLAAFNVKPRRTKDKRISMVELGLSGDFAIYNWRTGEITDGDVIEFGDMPKNDAFYYMLCPRLDNGMVVLGETDKLVPLSRVRFEKIAYDSGRLDMEIAGVPGEIVNVSLFVENAPLKIVGDTGDLPAVGSPIMTIPVRIGAEGKERLTVE